MNVFVVDEDPEAAARALHDDHLGKMLIESAQLLCTALWSHGVAAPYRPTHEGHPCAVWTRSTRDNFRWLGLYAASLATEYEHRFVRSHASARVAELAVGLGLTIPEGPLTDHPLAMPDAYRGARRAAPTAEAVPLYRAYYRGEKLTPRGRDARWTRRGAPAWIDAGAGPYQPDALRGQPIHRGETVETVDRIVAVVDGVPR